jgi:metal-responsive CopG/Arc/MetJ family transcriptional regulator
MARILVDLPDRHVEVLGEIAAAEAVPRAEIIRKAVAAYVERHQPVQASAFGIWKKRAVDGLDYQEKARSEW